VITLSPAVPDPRPFLDDEIVDADLIKAGRDRETGLRATDD